MIIEIRDFQVQCIYKSYYFTLLTKSSVRPKLINRFQNKGFNCTRSRQSTKYEYTSVSTYLCRPYPGHLRTGVVWWQDRIPFCGPGTLWGVGTPTVSWGLYCIDIACDPGRSRCSHSAPNKVWIFVSASRLFLKIARSRSRNMRSPWILPVDWMGHFKFCGVLMSWKTGNSCDH